MIGGGDLLFVFLAIKRVLMEFGRSGPRRDVKMDGEGTLLIMFVP